MNKCTNTGHLAIHETPWPRSLLRKPKQRCWRTNQQVQLFAHHLVSFQRWSEKTSGARVREWWRNQPLSMVCACVCHVACCASACVASKKKKTGLTSRIRRQTCFDHKQTIEISVCGICKCKWRILELMLSAFIHSFIHSFIYLFIHRLRSGSDVAFLSRRIQCK